MTIVKPVWHTILKQLELLDHIMLCDVSTWWNSTFDMLNFAVDNKAAINKLTGDQSMELQTFELHNSDWEIARQLHNTLQIFKDATMFFSWATPNLATVIPAMDIIDKCLTTDSRKRSLSVTIHVAISVAQTMMNKYYTKTDLSEVYRIAMGKQSLASVEPTHFPHVSPPPTA